MIDRNKLAKVLAYLASPIDGEALAATRKAVELFDKAGLRPEQLVDGIPKDDLGIRIVSTSFDDLAKAMREAAERSEQAARATLSRRCQFYRRGAVMARGAETVEPQHGGGDVLRGILPIPIAPFAHTVITAFEAADLAPCGVEFGLQA